MIRVVDLPWGVSHPQVKYWKDKKVHVFKGPILPDSLQPYAADDYSYARWIEDEQNGSVLAPQRGHVTFTPYKHQTIAAKKIKQAYDQGERGFLEADETGLGKTLATLVGVCAVAKQEGFGVKRRARLLVVCPKGAIPTWRQTLRSYPVSSALTRTMVTNYHQIHKLLETPPQARAAKKKRTKSRQTARHGKPLIDWDFIIFDEAQYLKNYPKSTLSMSAASVAQLNEKYTPGKTPFVIYSTATPGSTPLNLSIMSGILSPRLGKKDVTPDTWGPFIEQKGFHVKKGKVGYTWVSAHWSGKNSDDPKERKRYEENLRQAKAKQRTDVKKIGTALTHPQSPFIRRKPEDIEGWPAKQLVPLPLELSMKQRPIYEYAWSAFRAFLKLPKAKRDSSARFVESLRFRQKASLLKVEHVMESVKDFVESGKQVYISCEFLETIDAYREALDKADIPYAELSGRLVNERDSERLRFQKGEALVVLSNIVEAISLHAEESLPDGTKATKADRVSIIHDVRQNAEDADQALGRAHREGKNSVIYFPFFADTVDEKVIGNYVNKRSNGRTMLGIPTEEAVDMEDIFEREASLT